MHTQYIVQTSDITTINNGRLVVIPGEDIFISPHKSMAEGFIETIRGFSVARGIPFDESVFKITTEITQ